MEKPELTKPEITLVKKGLFYYIFQLLFLPIRLLLFLFKFILKYVKIYLGIMKEHQNYLKKSKSLNKMLSKKPLDNEIL